MARPTKRQRRNGRHAPNQDVRPRGQGNDGDATFSGDAVSSTVPASTPRDRPIPWRRNLYAVGAAQLLAIIGFSLRAPFLPFYLGDLGVASSESQALWSGLINAAGAGVMAISAPFWGIIADRRGRRPMLLRAMIASTFTIGLMGFATQPWHLLALRLVEGLLSGTVTASTTLVAATTPRPRLGYALGMVQTAVFAGSSLGPLFGGLLADSIGPRATFGVASGCLGTAALLVLFLVRERFVPPKPQPAAQPGDRRRWAGWQAAVGFPLGQQLLLLVLVLFVVRLASMAVQPIVPLFVRELAPNTTDLSSLSGLVLGVLGLTSALSAVYLGRLGDRRGHRRVLFASVIAAGIFYLPMAFVAHPWQLIALQALFGVAAGGLIPSANTLVANLTPPERRGAIYGLTAAAAAMGGFIGPLAGAAIAAGFGFRAPFFGVAMLLLALAVAVRSLRLRVASSEPD
ncbi:MAG: MFS transporter [Chloroflexia bacterium]|nr:MFS transporter [Chloroflexia bacterium]